MSNIGIIAFICALIGYVAGAVVSALLHMKDQKKMLMGTLYLDFEDPDKESVSLNLELEKDLDELPKQSFAILKIISRQKHSQ